MTVGWVRYNLVPWAHTLLVEEVQSDLPNVRKATTQEGEFRERLEAEHRIEVVEAALGLLEPFVDRFYEDALALIFDLARAQGLVVEMLTYETKVKVVPPDGNPPPRSVYEALPKAMGMTKRRQSSIMPELPEVWHYVPNKKP